MASFASSITKQQDLYITFNLPKAKYMNNANDLYTVRPSLSILIPSLSILIPSPSIPFLSLLLFHISFTPHLMTGSVQGGQARTICCCEGAEDTLDQGTVALTTCD